MYVEYMGRDSSVDIATLYTLDVLGFKSRCGEDKAPLETGSGAQLVFCTIDTASFSEGKAASAWRWSHIHIWRPG